VKFWGIRGPAPSLPSSRAPDKTGSRSHTHTYTHARTDTQLATPGATPELSLRRTRTKGPLKRVLYRPITVLTCVLVKERESSVNPEGWSCCACCGFWDARACLRFRARAWRRPRYRSSPSANPSCLKACPVREKS